MDWLRRSRVGPDLWREAPWLLLTTAALAAPFAVLAQGGDAQTAVLAGLACLASPCFAIETMLGLARLAQVMDRH